MAYLSLYRRQRPLTFSGITGQEHVARTLKHALSRGQLTHAYLFCGPRGTGKTTAAKILARAVNCRNYPVPEPCGECISCRNILNGVSMDVIEMDAASNRGIEEIRDLRERTRYASGESRYKVYIIDEAHMLTNEACNAFLKTLEEPPPGVIFILATTDPSRLPSTIVSRCQRFDFHLLRLSQIAQRLSQVIEEEGWLAEEEALKLIARLAEGSMRDALGLLEQCHAYGDRLVTQEHVRTVTGATRSDTIGALIKSLADNDLGGAIGVLQQITYSGRDLSLFLSDMIFIFIRLLLRGEAKGLPEDDDCHDFEDILQLYQGRFSRKALLEIIELLHQVSGELRHAHYPQFVLEIALIRMARVFDWANEPDRKDTVIPQQESWLETESVSPEKKALSTVKGQSVPAAPIENINDPPIGCSADIKAQQELSEINNASGSVIPESRSPAFSRVAGDDLEKLWPHILAEIRKSQPSTHDYLNMAQSRVLRKGQLLLTYRKGIFAAERIGDKNHRHLVERVLHKFLARSVRLTVLTTELPEEKVTQPGNEQAAEQSAAVQFAKVAKTDNRQGAIEGGYDFDDARKLFGGTVVEQQKEGSS